MKTLLRNARILSLALMMVMLLNVTVEPPRGAHAGCGSDVTWFNSSETNGHQTSSASGTTSDWSNTIDQYSDDGQTFHSNQTSHTNPDGSSTSHDETSYTDQNGNGCNSDGGPSSGRATTDEERDKDGNRKQHHEEIIRKDGKCMKLVWDREWDRKGELIKDVKSETEVPCPSGYILEWTREGGSSVGGEAIQWGPDTVSIPLESKGGAYQGSQKGSLHGTMSGQCPGVLNYPESVEVTTKQDEDQLALEELEFTVTVTMSTEMVNCAGASSTSPVTFTRTFILPIKDGASWVSSTPMQGGQVTDTFTLKIPGDRLAP